MKQIWKCNVCSTERQYGATVYNSKESLDQPLLICDKCKENTRHSFSRMQYSEFENHV